MKITEKALLANGWEETPGGFSHDIIEWRLRLYVWFEKDGHSHVSFESFNPSFTRLPNITSMEALSQLEFLLSETPALPKDGELAQMIEHGEIG